MQPFPQPLSGNDMPRFGGLASMMRLPVETDLTKLDACFVGVPLDLGTSNRTGTRAGPRQIRSESVMLRPYNMATRIAPFERMRVADYGDIAINPYNLLDSIERIEAAFARIAAADCRPVTLGGDHTIVLPILRAMHKRYGKLGLVHVDAHADVNDTMFGEKIAHGTPFRRAVEEGLLDCSRVVQIGLRGTGYSADEFDWGRRQGFQVIPAEECWHRSLQPLMQSVKARVAGGPVYLSFDIDGLDPAYAPGTGTLEIGGLTVPQGLEIIRGLAGVDLVGGDVVEVSPPFDPFGATALLAANLAFEILCIISHTV